MSRQKRRRKHRNLGMKAQHFRALLQETVQTTLDAAGLAKERTEKPIRQEEPKTSGHVSYIGIIGEIQVEQLAEILKTAAYPLVPAEIDCYQVGFDGAVQFLMAQPPVQIVIVGYSWDVENICAVLTDIAFVAELANIPYIVYIDDVKGSFVARSFGQASIHDTDGQLFQTKAYFEE